MLVREEVVRQRLEACDDDAGVADWLDDVQQAQFAQPTLSSMKLSGRIV